MTQKNSRSETTDDFVKENAKLRNDAGLKCYLTRYTSGNCCKWCDDLAGKYEYESAPDDIFRRHDNCDCVVTYECGRTRQDVWSKKSWEAPETDKSAYKSQVLSREQAKAIEAQNMQYKGIDKSGESNIIKLGINLFDKSDPIYLDAFSIEEEKGFKDVFIHGSSSCVQITYEGKPKNISPKEFVDVLKENGYFGGNIRLASCSTGAGENSFAQQLSKELGVTVKAPDSDVYFIPNDGVLFVGSPYENIGKWRKFKNGVEIND